MRPIAYLGLHSYTSVHRHAGDPPFRSWRSICFGGVSQDDAVRRFSGLDEPQADCYDNAPMESFFHTLKTEPSITSIMKHVRKPDVSFLRIDGHLY